MLTPCVFTFTWRREPIKHKGELFIDRDDQVFLFSDEERLNGTSPNNYSAFGVSKYKYSWFLGEGKFIANRIRKGMAVNDDIVSCEIKRKRVTYESA